MQGELRMKLADENGNEDELLLYLVEGMTTEKDAGDANKFFDHPDGFPKLTSVESGRNLMMDCRAPLNNETQTFDLSLLAGKEGKYTLKASTLDQFPIGTEVVLEDLQRKHFD